MKPRLLTVIRSRDFLYEFYKAWHGKSTIHPEIAEISAVGHTSDTENLN